MELLREIPDSVLWLAKFSDLAMDNLRRRSVEHGVAPDRLIFAPLARLDEHMRRLQAADLFLDTAPYSAGATASHTLGSGVPLLTRAGRSYVSRMAGSLLTAVECPELITHDLAAYKDRALQLARDASLRRQLRARIAANRHKLFDCTRFTRGLERAFDAMWQRFEQGLAPAHIDLGEDAQRE
jgi:predicted O-linked N-acetylglucosamine transferase (SPINDLY family)